MTTIVDSTRTLHGLVTVAAHPLPEAGVLHVIRNAVIAILAIVFVVGLVLGFLVGRMFGRHD